MNIKNYTSEVPTERSVENIEKLLVQIGASHIGHFYDQQDLAGIVFNINIHNQSFNFKLPANPEGIYRALLQERKHKMNKKAEEKYRSQANRTAWKLLHEWVHIQLSLIESNQAETLQIFLPYAFNGKETLYEKFKNNGFRALTEGSNK